MKASWPSDISSGLMSRGPAFRRCNEIPLRLSYRSQSKVIPDLKLRKRISLTEYSSGSRSNVVESDFPSEIAMPCLK
jgi:hypothetical protein